MTEDNNMQVQSNKNKTFLLISVGVFMATLALPAILWGVVTLLPGNVLKTLDYDLGEKRNKAEFPKQFTSAYGAGLEAYYNDRLPFRSIIISANRKLTAIIEKPYDETISPYLVKMVYQQTSNEQQEEVPAPEMIEEEKTVTVENAVEESTINEDALVAENVVTESVPEKEENTPKNQTPSESAAPESQTPSEEATPESQMPVESATPENPEAEENVAENSVEETKVEEDLEEETDLVKKYKNEPVPNYPLNTNDPSFLPPKIYNNLTIIGKEGWLFFAKENALEDYIANNILSQNQMQEYLNGMLKLQGICTSQGKRLYFIIPPNKEQVYAEKMPSYAVGDENKRAQRLVDYIHANSDIQIVYPINEMKAAKASCQPYFKTDTHWTEAGAYVGVQALYALMGMQMQDIENVSKTTSQYLGGDLVLLGNLDQGNYADDIRYHVNYKTDINVTNVDGTKVSDNLFKAASSSANQAKIVVVGDSFRIFMAQYLTKDFSNYTHVHWKHMKDPGVAEAIIEADIIVVESVERISNYVPRTMETICGILQP